MEAKANGVKGAQGKNAMTERHLSVLTPTSASRCDPFNEACASDLALLSSGKISFQKKHRIIQVTPLHHSMPGISAARKLARHVVCGNHATPTGGRDSLSARATQ